MSTSLIDQIVDGVLKQLAGGGAAPERGSRTEELGGNAAKTKLPSQVVLNEKVITADLLEVTRIDDAVVVVSEKAIVTPAALDYLKERQLTVQRGSTTQPIASPSTINPQATTSPLLIIVHHTDAIDRLWDDLKTTWTKELTGCPDDAAKLAIAELSRGGVSQVVILAEQTFRAACLANRGERVKAAAIGGIGDIKSARKQLRVNTWCFNPVGLSWFELRNVFKAIEAK